MLITRKPLAFSSFPQLVLNNTPFELLSSTSSQQYPLELLSSTSSQQYPLELLS